MTATTAIDLVWVINGLLFLVVTMIGVIVGNVWIEIRELRKARHAHTSEVAALKILVVGDYIKRTELTDIMRDVTREVRETIQNLTKHVDSGFADLHEELKNKQDKQR